MQDKALFWTKVGAIAGVAAAAIALVQCSMSQANSSRPRPGAQVQGPSAQSLPAATVAEQPAVAADEPVATVATPTHESEPPAEPAVPAQTRRAEDRTNTVAAPSASPTRQVEAQTEFRPQRDPVPLKLEHRGQ